MLREFLIGSIKLSVFIAGALHFSHDKQTKMMKISLGIVFISAIMLPIVDIINENGFDFENTISGCDKDFENVSGEIEKEIFERCIADYISSEYSLDKDFVKVRVEELDFSSMSAGRIRILLSGKGVYIDYKSLANDIESEFTDGGVCEIELVVG